MIGKRILFLLLFTGTNHFVFSQGCSDAGFCTIGALKPQQNADSIYRHQFNLSLSYGIGEQGTVILQAIPELNFSFFKNNSIQIKVPFNQVNGNLANTSGIGDITLSLTQTVVKKNNLGLSFTLGGKIATGTSDLEKDNLPLPMPYQHSLGSYDLILGGALQYKNWNFGAGFQAVVSNKNNNAFLKARWLTNPDGQKYFESNKLSRGNDFLLRVERAFKWNKFYFSPGLLGIYRIQQDKISVGLINENFIKVDGSDGITLNLTGSILYQLTKKSSLSLSFGTPLLVREVRPDGLTRALVINFGYGIKFGK